MSAVEGDGFNESFIGVRVPFPTFTGDLAGNVLTNESWADSAWTPYVHFSVATNTEMRSPICSAMIVDQEKMTDVKRSNRFFFDARVGEDYQLDNAYYRDNPWDRGHMSDRGSAAWGDTEEEARDASDSSFAFTNIALQHENHNQDEWNALELWIRGPQRQVRHLHRPHLR
jgi:endonuclease G, mitochondrial